MQPLTLGRYRLIQRLARGATGAVYQARDTDERSVAVKVLLPGHRVLARLFRQEVILVSELDHPHVLPILATGVVDDDVPGDGPEPGALWFAMPYCDGGTLASRPPTTFAELSVALQQLLLADGPDKDMASVAHALAAPLWCVDATVTLLTAGTPRMAVLGSIETIHESSLDDDAEAAVYARREDLAPLLIDLLNGDDDVLAAGAARALCQVGTHGDVLRSALLATKSSSVRWGTLVSIGELDEPGPAAVFLEVLGREGRHGVRNRLHGQLARMPDPEDVARGLALVRDDGDYRAYHWRAVYRPESLSEAHRAVYRADAGRRLAAPEPRTRQAAAQVLGALGPGAHGETLRALADSDPESYVRAAAAKALAP